MSNRIVATETQTKTTYESGTVHTVSSVHGHMVVTQSGWCSGYLQMDMYVKVGKWAFTTKDGKSFCEPDADVVARMLGRPGCSSSSSSPSTGAAAEMSRTRYYVFRYDGSNYKLVQSDEAARFVGPTEKQSPGNIHAALTNELRTHGILQLDDVILLDGKWELFRRMTNSDPGYTPYCIKFEELDDRCQTVQRLCKEYDL